MEETRHQGQRRPPARDTDEAVSRFRAAFGTPDELDALALRIRRMAELQGVSIDHSTSVAAAQRVLTTGENVFRGDLHIYVDHETGRLVMMPPYDRMVALAKGQAGYAEMFEDMDPDDLGEGDIGVICYILRNDNLPLLQTLLQTGVDYMQAIRQISSQGKGIVRRGEMTNAEGQTRETVRNWSWEETARKRALTKALRLSHGMPAQAMMVANSWMVGDTVTDWQDWMEAWDDAPGDPPAMEQAAKLSANTRAQLAKMESMDPEERDAMLAANNELLHGTSEPEL